MFKLRSILHTAVLAILFSLLTVGVASAKPRFITLDEAVLEIKKTSGSKILSAKEHNKGGERFYLIKTIKKGKIRLIRIDPKTGKQF